MLWALLPPVAIEVYSISKRRKPSLISLAAIVGILLVGVISMMGLSEEWLGVRRAAIYVIEAFIIVIVIRFKYELVDKILAKIIDTKAVQNAVKKNKTELQLANHTTKVGYLYAGFLLLISVWSYLLTLLVITEHGGSSEFNIEYAKLRLLSIPFVTLPFLVGTVGLLIYLVSGFEKYTGMEPNELLKKKH
jgi:uncharacterized membrane protein